MKNLNPILLQKSKKPVFLQIIGEKIEPLFSSQRSENAEQHAVVEVEQKSLQLRFGQVVENVDVAAGFQARKHRLQRDAVVGNVVQRGLDVDELRLYRGRAVRWKVNSDEFVLLKRFSLVLDVKQHDSLGPEAGYNLLRNLPVTAAKIAELLNTNILCELFQILNAGYFRVNSLHLRPILFEKWYYYTVVGVLKR